jgi:hypothetical protein
MLRDTGDESDASSATTGEGAPRVLACARCERAITSTAERIDMNGSHEHAFVNPDNERFRIGCFNNAPGLLRVGPASLEATWFAGYSWQGEVCASCRGFLGWLYRRGEHRFHGLILAGLIEVDEN